MYNESIMNSVYEDSFNNELQKLASGSSFAPIALGLLTLGGLGGLIGMDAADSVESAGMVEANEMPSSMYLSDNQLNVVQSVIDSQKRNDGKFKSFSLRHPFLTGAASLGIAPSVVATDIRDAAMSKVKRSDPKFAAKFREAVNAEMLAEAARRNAEAQSSMASNDSLRLVREIRNS